MSGIASRLRFAPVLLLFALAFLPPDASSAEGNSCSLGEVRAEGESSFSVEIMIDNSDTLAGFQIPFSFDYGEVPIRCDSISFAGAECWDFGFLDTKIDNDAKIAYLAATNNGRVEDDIPPLAPGRHKVATAFFSVGRIDRGTNVSFAPSRVPDDFRDYSLLFWTPAAEEVEAVFNFGQFILR